jgi:hypothetical protein
VRRPRAERACGPWTGLVHTCARCHALYTKMLVLCSGDCQSRLQEVSAGLPHRARQGDRACSDSVASANLPRRRGMLLRAGAHRGSEVRGAWLVRRGHVCGQQQTAAGRQHPTVHADHCCTGSRPCRSSGRGVDQGGVGHSCVGGIVPHAVSLSWAPRGTWRAEVTGPYLYAFGVPWTVIRRRDHLGHRDVKGLIVHA